MDSKSPTADFKKNRDDSPAQLIATVGVLCERAI